MVNPEAVQEWKANPVTLAMMELIEQEKQRLMEAMANGHFLNLENMEESFGNTAKFVGKCEGLDTLKNIVEEEADE